jgi:low temperature requirement protein LtrA
MHASPRISSPPRLLSPRCSTLRASALRASNRRFRYLAAPHMTHEPESEPTGLLTVPMTVWLELFYDLVFVAAILVLSDAASHLHNGTRVGRVVAIFVGLWSVWLATTLFNNRFRVNDIKHRLLVLAQMFVVVLVAMEAHAGMKRDATYLSLTYAGLVASVAVMYTRVVRTSLTGADDARRRARAAWIGVSLFLVAAVLPWPVSSGAWVAGFAAFIVSTLAGTRATGSGTGIREHHLVERMGAFTIIVCGEAFVKVAIAVSGSSVLEVDVVALFFQFVLTFAIWTSYFEDVPHVGIRAGWLRAWLGLHLVLQLAIAGTAIGVAKLVKVGPLDHVPSDDILEITATLATVYLALALIGACTRRRPARGLFALRLATSAVVVVVGVGVWQIDFVDLVEGVAALSVVAVLYAVASYRLTRDTGMDAAQ